VRPNSRHERVHVIILAVSLFFGHYLNFQIPLRKISGVDVFHQITLRKNPYHLLSFVLLLREIPDSLRRFEMEFHVSTLVSIVQHRIGVTTIVHVAVSVWGSPV
jgi:hypothetical protein